MIKIEISVLGSWSLRSLASPIKKEPRRKEQALLAYLAVESDRAHSRDSLVGLFWPDMSPSDARNNLRVALSRLKQHLGSDSVLETTRHSVRFHLGNQVSLDVNQFLTLIKNTERHDHRSLTACLMCLDRLNQAVALYQGEFLAGFFLENCLAFEEWLFVWRERLHVQVLKQLAQLVQMAGESGRFADAERFARRQIELDPLHENAHRQLMRFSYAQGKRSAALTQFKVCAAILQKELGVEPEAETDQLRQAIQAGTLDISTPKLNRSQDIRYALPEISTPFVGREVELHQLGQRLINRDYRLISLVGPGGIGKTRLAVQAARLHRDAFEDGVFFVPLEGVQNASEISAAIAEAIGLPLTGSAASPKAEIIQALQVKQCLLVIDNLEHLIDEGANLLLELLGAAPHIVLLVTSRERLNSQMEDLFRLRGLPYPEMDDEGDYGRFASVRLFVDRAHRIQKSFALNKANAQEVSAICRLVEGLPLGLELAAAWVRDFSVEQIVASLQEDFDLLETDLRDISPRHRSMATVFEHSWRLLTPKEQTVLAQLSIFRGGFTLAAAQMVAGASPLQLTRLRYKSLIRGSGNGRYTMHELLSQLSRRKLQEIGDLSHQTEARHSRAYLALLSEQAPRLNRADAAAASALLRLELDNIRRAWRWAIQHAAFDMLRQSTEGLAAFFFHAGLAFEGVQRLQMAVEAVQAAGESEGPLLPHLLVKQLELSGHFISYDEIVAIVQQILQLTKQKPEWANIEGEAYLLWANQILDKLSDPKQAQIYLDKAAVVIEETGDLELKAQLHCDYGRFCFFDGQFDQAVIRLKKGLALYEELNHLAGQASAYARLAPAYVEAFVLGPGLYCDRKALSLYTQMDNRTRMGYTQHGLGETYMILGAYAQAIEQFDKSLALYRRQGNKQNEANILAPYATALNGLGQTTEAEKYFRLAIGQQKEYRLNYCLCVSLLDWGTFQLQQGWLVEAEITFNEALNLNRHKQHLRLTSLTKLATVYLAAQREKEAFALADSVWREIEPAEGAGLPFPLDTMYECYSIFQACGDERAEAVLHMAGIVLQRTAAEIDDPQMQTCFLNNVPVNKLILQLIGKSKE